MEEVFVYAFPALSISLWLLTLARKKDGNGLVVRMLQLVPVSLVTGIMLLDVRSFTDVTPVLAADMLFLDAFILQAVRFQSEKKRFSAYLLIISAVGLGRSVALLCGLRFPLEATCYMSLSAVLLLTYSVLEELVRIVLSGRLRSVIHEHVAFVFMKNAGAQVLTLLCASVMAVDAFCGASARFFFLIVLLLLAVIYLYFQVTYPPGVSMLRMVPSQGTARRAASDQDRIKDETRRMEQLFEKVEAYMKEEQPYLDDMFTMTRLAADMLTNKTMLSKTINEISGKNFCKYVNSYRIQYAVSLMKSDSRLRVGELSLMCGFHSVASFNMAFKLVMNDTPSEYMRTLHSEGLATTQEGERRSPEGLP